MGLSGMNKYSIGIELDNAGMLERVAGRWRSWFGGNYDDKDVMVAVHKNETQERGWHLFSPEQIEAAVEVSRMLIAKYGLYDVIGHDDIAPRRKLDPGPAFPMNSFRSKVLGRNADEVEVLETTTHLNIRKGAGSGYDLVPGGPLPPLTRVVIEDSRGSWRFVQVRDTVSGIMDLEGWVHGAFLRLTST